MAANLEDTAGPSHIAIATARFDIYLTLKYLDVKAIRSNEQRQIGIVDGRKLITRAYAQHAADLEQLMSASLTTRERATLISLLKKVGYKAAAQSGEDAA